MPEPVPATPLQRAADAFELIVAERGWGEPPLLLRTQGGVDPDQGAELAVRPLDGHPAESLLGFRAPIGWAAVGVSTEGWAVRYDAEPTGYRADAAPGAARQRVRSIVVVDRDHNLAGGLRWQDGRVINEAPAEGLVVDCLRRALGLRTPPPSTSTDVLFAVLWLEAVVAAAPRGSRALTWRQAAGLHPAVRLLAGDGQPQHSIDLVDSARALGRVCDWAMIRSQVIRGWDAGLGAPMATWMDAGMVSRWLLDRRPPLAELVSGARRRTTPAAYRRIVEALAGLGVAGDGGVAGRGLPDAASLSG